MTYLGMVEAYKKEIIVEAWVIINDKTMQVSYAFATNLHADLGICCEMFFGLHTTKKREFNKTLQQYQKVLGKKLKLEKTLNTFNHTRLIYSNR